MASQHKTPFTRSLASFLPAASGDLKGHYVLILEHDPHRADEYTMAARDAGAEIVGPFSNELAAVDSISDHAPTAAILDADFGGRSKFALARALLSRGIPFVMVSDDDNAAFPADLHHVPKVAKLCRAEAVVEALQRRAVPTVRQAALHRFL